MATILNLGTPGTTPGILHPKQAHKFIVQFQNIGGAVDSQVLTRQVISVSKPSVTFNEIAIHRYNAAAYVAGKHTWANLALVIEDDIGSGAAEVIRAQVERQLTLIADGAAPLGLSAAVAGGAYKFNTVILQLDGTGADAGEPNFLEKWTCQGCWFSNVTYGDLSNETDTAMHISTQIRFDHAFVEYNNSIEPKSALTGE
jgi:hypothetical protein